MVPDVRKVWQQNVPSTVMLYFSNRARNGNSIESSSLTGAYTMSLAAGCTLMGRERDPMPMFAARASSRRNSSNSDSRPQTNTVN